MSKSDAKTRPIAATWADSKRFARCTAKRRSRNSRESTSRHGWNLRTPGRRDRERNLIILKKHKTVKKLQRPREIGVGRIMARLLIRAIGERTEGPIFLDEKGKRWKEEKLSRKYTKLRNELGISKELVLYCARHEHGTKVCRKHGIAAAQHSLGHSDIHTTQRYVHPDPAQLAGYQDSLF